ncbi:hypothetical protein AN639_01065 [Candidatus Epulonipiscium fishelsonii]|uniref:Uncharacterized protein n=1 Tax=Candidatus Epulonipiscium fishelsonii TaxID=77094 RepID=A0ACC8X7T6_9FIRM|nr:hypothetical protein AN396_12180 [Epulopiscium sp. SCG-B11WGA-EpuloA1]ONI40699.1 hypothetical protein AN639_01065 [Epulopiscium sp. SCG-B05WGA-EpuloA1]
MKDKEQLFKEITEIFIQANEENERDGLSLEENSNLHTTDYEIEIIKLEFKRALQLYVYATISNQLNLTIIKNINFSLDKLEKDYDMSVISMEISVFDLDLIVKTTDKLAPKKVIILNPFSTDLEIVRFHIKLQEQFLRMA